MSVVVEKPYTFVPPRRGDLWPTLIQRFRLVDIYLRRKEGVVSFECRHADRLRESLRAGHGILLAPNHCRYADPLVLGWLARTVGTHVFAMASWHLFNKSWFDRFSIPRMGGFSIFREGLDRQSLETAIEILDTAARPLIVFPEGTTNRCNDRLQPLLDGVMFLARSAARRRSKRGAGKVVIHPVGIKYLFRGEILSWGEKAIAPLEDHLSWRQWPDLPLLARVERVVQGLFSLKEVEYFGGTGSGSLPSRRDALIERLLRPAEEEAFGQTSSEPVLLRVRACRAKIVQKLLSADCSEAEKEHLRRQAIDVELAQKLDAYPSDYLAAGKVTETRLLETIERMHEDLFGRGCNPSPLHAVIDVDEGIEVDDQRVPRDSEDPLLALLRQRLLRLLESLAAEARPLPQLAVSSIASSRLSSAIVAN